METYPITKEDFYKVNGLKDKYFVDELFMEELSSFIQWLSQKIY